MDVNKIKVLDVGSGNGLYAFALAEMGAKVVGVEPYKKAYDNSVKSNKYKNVSFYNSLIEDFNAKDKFDLILSLTTLEHMPNAKKSFNHIFDMLKPGGYLYVTAPNKLWPVECHYQLPFLSYLPLSFANIYLGMTKRGESYKDSSYAMTYWQIKKFFKQFLCSFTFVIPDSKASYIGCGAQSKTQFIKTLGIFLISKFPFMWAFSKGFIVLAKKDLS